MITTATYTSGPNPGVMFGGDYAEANPSAGQGRTRAIPAKARHFRILSLKRVKNSHNGVPGSKIERPKLLPLT